MPFEQANRRHLLPTEPPGEPLHDVVRSSAAPVDKEPLKSERSDPSGSLSTPVAELLTTPVGPCDEAACTASDPC